MRAVTRIAAALAAMLLLLTPALWNGFPLLQYDTGGYLARWHEGTLEESRSTVYGLFVAALAPFDFWPVLLVHAAATVWIVALVLRAHGLGGRPAVLLLTLLPLAALTTLPWIVDVILTDIFAGLSVLALYLLLMRPDSLRGVERAALVLFIAFCAATHSATLAVLVLLLLAYTLMTGLARERTRLLQVRAALVALALSVAMVLAANYAVAGRLAWTPGGAAIVFGRMLQAGIVARYLDDHCPDPRLRLCAHRNELPATADAFFWGDSVFQRLGRFRGLDQEMRTIVLESLIQYPWLQIKTAVIAVAEQIVKVRTGYGVHTEIWHTTAMIERFARAAVPAMKAAHQQRGELDFAAINAVHVPVAFGSMALLLCIAGLGLLHRPLQDIAELAITVVAALLANALVCGALSNPNDRYGARMVWLAALVILLVPWRIRQQRQSSHMQA